MATNSWSASSPRMVKAVDAAGFYGRLERAGDDGLNRLWRSAAELPTPAEIDAPGLWLARIDLPT